MFSSARRLWLLLPVLLVACETTRHKPVEAPPAPEPEPQLPLETRWQQSRSLLPNPDPLSSRLQGRSLVKAVSRAARTEKPLKQVLARLQSARARAREARAIVGELLGYRKAGGVQLGREERQLWKRLSEAEAGKPVEIQDFELVRARQSLAVQAGRAWFQLQAIHRLYRQADSARMLREQIVERHQTGNRLERTDRQKVLDARKDLARADTRLKQLKRAERLAAKALTSLLGRSVVPSDTEGGVKQLPAAQLQQLAGRSDLRLAREALVSAGLPFSWPAVRLTTGHEGITNAFYRLSRLDSAGLRRELGLQPVTETRSEAVEVLLTRLHAALAEARTAVYRIRQLRDQAGKLQKSLQESRRKVNRLRARYSARRADLLEILQAQVRMTDLAARHGYVERRLQDQRLRAGFALGLF